MKSLLAAWAAWFLFLLLLGFSVPFQSLEDVTSLAGSFLFWTLEVKPIEVNFGGRPKPFLPTLRRSYV